MLTGAERQYEVEQAEESLGRAFDMADQISSMLGSRLNRRGNFWKCPDTEGQTRPAQHDAREPAESFLEKEFSMLVLSMKRGERILVGENIVLTAVETRAGSVRVGIAAPREINIIREKVGPVRQTVQLSESDLDDLGRRHEHGGEA